MPFIPHTEADIKAMLEAVGVDSIEALFDEIPHALRTKELRVGPGLSEMELARFMRERAERDGHYLNFIGAGAYEHHIPAAVWELATRGEYYSAYTPYQAEASQGTLQVLYEFQSMMASLTGLDVANASLYDGASALAEAVLMAVRCHKRARRVLVTAGVHPIHRRVTRTIVGNQQIELVEIAYDARGGHASLAALAAHEGTDCAALVIAQPNFFGVLEEIDALTDWAHGQGMLVVALVNPVALAVLKPPGEWGERGADIAVGEGQPLGAPLSSGGPYFGFMCCKQAHVRQMPGRIVGRTVDLDGRPGFTLTLQAREQHIRRSKATSNICTNQGLLATAATMHLALLGREGLERVAAQCHAHTLALVRRLTRIPGVEQVFERPLFHEALLRVDRRAREVLRALEAERILGGYEAGAHYPELGETILVCATETRTAADIERYGACLERIMGKPRAATKARVADSD